MAISPAQYRLLQKARRDPAFAAARGIRPAAARRPAPLPAPVSPVSGFDSPMQDPGSAMAALGQVRGGRRGARRRQVPTG